jgi:flagellar L-ring protein precursor FlgH
MSARIIELLSNGDLKIEGRRMVEINGEEQITVLTGIVRPSDVLADNTVYSFLIADASISYRGRGLVDDAAKPGILSRFVNWLF